MALLSGSPSPSLSALLSSRPFSALSPLASASSAFLSPNPLPLPALYAPSAPRDLDLRLPGFPSPPALRPKHSPHAPRLPPFLEDPFPGCGFREIREIAVPGISIPARGFPLPFSAPAHPALAPKIWAGGGPRTFPGGVTKWQWKRMQEKKRRARERAQLIREQEAFEAKRREQLRILRGPERPWGEESDRGWGKPPREGRMPPVLPPRSAGPPLPWEKPRGVDDTARRWGEEDGGGGLWKGLGEEEGTGGMIVPWERQGGKAEGKADWGSAREEQLGKSDWRNQGGMAEGLGGKGEGGPVRWERLPQVPLAERRRQAGGERGWGEERARGQQRAWGEERLREDQRNRGGQRGRAAPMAGEGVRPWQREGEGEMRQQWQRGEEGEMRQWRREEEGGMRQQQRGEEGGRVWWEEDAEEGAERGMRPRERGERGRGERGTARGRGEGDDLNNSLDTRTTWGGTGVRGGRMNERGEMEELAEEWGKEGEEGGEGWVWWEEGGLYGRGRGGGEKGGGGGREGSGRGGGERREGGTGGDGMGAGRAGGRGGGEGKASSEARQARQAQPPAAFSTPREEAGRGRGEERERAWGVGGGARGRGGGRGGGGRGRGGGQRGAYAYQGSSRASRGGGRGGGRGAPLVLPAVPEEVIGRHVKLKHVEDLWNEDDGPLERGSGAAYNEYGTSPGAGAAAAGADGTRERNIITPQGQSSAADNTKPDNTGDGCENSRSGSVGVEAGSFSALPLSQAMLSAVRSSMGVDTTATDKTERERADTSGEATSFTALPLSQAVLSSVRSSMGFKRCTPLQAATMPHILAGADLLVKGSSGTGKTMAYMRASREGSGAGSASAAAASAASVTAGAQKFARAGREHGSSGDGERSRWREERRRRSEAGGKGKRERSWRSGRHGQQGVGWQAVGVQMVVGGLSMDGEGRRLQQAPCQVLVATPARLLEHLQQTQGMRNRVQQMKVLVWEELDRMVEMGFTLTIHTIVPLLPRTRQTLLFSSALSNEISPPYPPHSPQRRQRQQRTAPEPQQPAGEASPPYRSSAPLSPHSPLPQPR
ncbi:unnamed protein product [Closterium sp. Naga37s-1]|nr:unnamed protein product [Closterium sp. Naga37s-1]